jgi:hypothetical protein
MHRIASRTIACATPRVAAIAAVGTVPPAASLVSSTSVPSAASLLSWQQHRAIQANEGTRRRAQDELLASAGTEYDLDKERWGRNMKWHSMECILDTNIHPARGWTWAGVKARVSRWISLKKLQERRPTFNVNDLRQLFTEYKKAQYSLQQDRYRALIGLTTFAEAERMKKEGMDELHRKMQNTSWRTLSRQQAAAKKTTTAAAAATNVNPTATTAAGSNGQSGSPAGATEGKDGKKEENPMPPEDLTPTSWGGLPYWIHMEDFEIVTTFTGQMTTEDWIQITCKATFLEKNNPLTTPPAEPRAAAAFQAAVAAREAEPASNPPGAFRITEYPVFEIKLGDGVATANTAPFVVVAVMDKDGARYGRDGQDAALLRKNFAAAKKGSSWFS